MSATSCTEAYETLLREREIHRPVVQRKLSKSKQSGNVFLTCRSELCIVFKSNAAKCLKDTTNNLTLCAMLQNVSCTHQTNSLSTVVVKEHRIRWEITTACPLVLGTFAVDLLAQDHRSKVYERTFRHKQWVRLSYQNRSPCSNMTGFVFVTQIWDCSVNTELIHLSSCAKTVSIVPSSAQKCIDNFPPPLLLSTPRVDGLVDRTTGCPLSPNFDIISSATLLHSPCGLLSWVEYHFFSDPGPKNDHLPGENLFA